MLEGLIAVGLGLVGGLLRVVIGGVVVGPQWEDDSDRRVYLLGSLSTVVAGGVAGFVAWALTTDALFADEGFGLKTIAVTLLAGVGGTEILLHYVNQQHGVTINQQANQEANQETGEIAGPLARTQETLVQDLSACQERERELREELERLKRDNTLDD